MALTELANNHAILCQCPEDILPKCALLGIVLQVANHPSQFLWEKEGKFSIVVGQFSIFRTLAPLGKTPDMGIAVTLRAAKSSGLVRNDNLSLILQPTLPFDHPRRYQMEEDTTFEIEQSNEGECNFRLSCRSTGKKLYLRHQSGKLKLCAAAWNDPAFCQDTVWRLWLIPRKSFYQ